MVTFKQYLEFSSNSFLFSALTICVVAVLSFTAEARHAMKTRPQGNPQMMALIEKMKERLAAPEAQDKLQAINGGCPWPTCPGYYCCSHADWTCCEKESPYICQPDDSTC